MRSLALICSMIVVSACAPQDRITSPVLPDAAGIGTTQTIFFATTRAKRPDGQFGTERTSLVHRGVADVSIPPNRTVGTISYGFDDPDPQTDFALSAMDEFQTSQAFRSSLSARVSSQQRGAREVSIFVHGFNTSFSEALFRMAQLKTDLEIPGVSVAYSWPSRATPLGYEYDEDSALFARNGLEAVLHDVTQSGTTGIVLVAHSMGSLVAMEALRQIERQNPGWSARNLAGVVLISPDLDVDLFRSQMSDLARIPEPFVIFTSKNDRALGLSALLSGEEDRLGSLDDINALSDFPVTVLDITALSTDRGLNHFVAGSSPTMISMMRQARRVDPDFMSGAPDANSGLFNAEQRFARNATELVIRPFR